MIQDLVIYAVYIGYALAVLLTFGTVLTWVERKQAAVMSDRIGANRAYIRIPFTQIKLVWWGLFHGIAEANVRDIAQVACTMGVISADEYALIKRRNELRDIVIHVDDFPYDFGFAKQQPQARKVAA